MAAAAAEAATESALGRQREDAEGDQLAVWKSRSRERL